MTDRDGLTRRAVLQTVAAERPASVAGCSAFESESDDAASPLRANAPQNSPDASHRRCTSTGRAVVPDGPATVHKRAGRRHRRRRVRRVQRVHERMADGEPPDPTAFYNVVGTRARRCCGPVLVLLGVRPVHDEFPLARLGSSARFHRYRTRQRTVTSRVRTPGGAEQRVPRPGPRDGAAHPLGTGLTLQRAVGQRRSRPVTRLPKRPVRGDRDSAVETIEDLAKFLSPTDYRATRVPTSLSRPGVRGRTAVRTRAAPVGQP